MSDKRQSINNYVYNRRRNRETEQVRHENDFNFSNESSIENHNTSSSMYNSYISENDYNSYTSNYNQPTQPQYNNYNQPSQVPYNRYDQPQNFAPTYKNNNATMLNGNFGGHNAVEIPLRDRTKLSMIIVLISFILRFVVTMVIGFLGTALNWDGNVLMVVMVTVFFIGFIGGGVGMVGSSAIDRKQLRKVCTTPVQGTLVGYDKHRRVHKRHHYNVYAPKYEIFINNRYEIRTIDDFRKSKGWDDRINLLANAGGYEIIPATRADLPKFHIGISEIISAIIIIAIFAYLLIPAIQKM